MSGPIFDRRMLAVEFRGEDDATALEELAKWLRTNQKRLDVTVITIAHEYADQYMPTTINAYLMVDDE